MPFTAFHVLAVWPLYSRWPQRWDVLALTCGAVMPDLEIVTVYPLVQGILDRGIMHSILGVVTVNLALALLAARVVVPAMAIRIDRRLPGRGWRRFAARDFVEDRKPWPTATLSAIVGGLTHLILDLPSHADTPLLWPWRGATFSLGPWAGDVLANAIASAVAGAAFLWMAWKWVGR